MTATSVIQFAGTVAAIATALVALAAVGLAVAVGTAADWDDWVGQTDGIHGTSAFFEGWLTAIADRMDSEVWFMPGFGSWPGPQVVIC